MFISQVILYFPLLGITTTLVSSNCIEYLTVAHANWISDLNNRHSEIHLDKMITIGHKLCDLAAECNQALQSFILDLIAISTVNSVAFYLMSGNFLFKMYDMQETAFYSSLTSISKVSCNQTGQHLFM